MTRSSSMEASSFWVGLFALSYLEDLVYYSGINELSLLGFPYVEARSIPTARILYMYMAASPSRH